MDCRASLAVTGGMDCRAALAVTEFMARSDGVYKRNKKRQPKLSFFVATLPGPRRCK